MQSNNSPLLLDRSQKDIRAQIDLRPTIMASPLHHQASRKAILDFAIKETVFASDVARSHAAALFAAVLQQFEAADMKQLSVPFRRIEMVRQIYQCALHQPSSDAYLRSFFSTVGIGMDSSLTTSSDTASLCSKIVEFTDYLIENFFLPCTFSVLA